MDTNKYKVNKKAFILVRILFVLSFLFGCFYLYETWRLSNILDKQKVELEKLSKEHRDKISKIQKDYEDGKITHKLAQEKMLNIHREIQEKNLDKLEKTLDRIVPSKEE